MAAAGALAQASLILGAAQGAAGEPWGEASPQQPPLHPQKVPHLTAQQQPAAQTLQSIPWLEIQPVSLVVIVSLTRLAHERPDWH